MDKTENSPKVLFDGHFNLKSELPVKISKPGTWHGKAVLQMKNAKSFGYINEKMTAAAKTIYQQP